MICLLFYMFWHHEPLLQLAMTALLLPGRVFGSELRPYRQRYAGHAVRLLALAPYVPNFQHDCMEVQRHGLQETISNLQTRLHHCGLRWSGKNTGSSEGKDAQDFCGTPLHAKGSGCVWQCRIIFLDLVVQNYRTALRGIGFKLLTFCEIGTESIASPKVADQLHQNVCSPITSLHLTFHYMCQSMSFPYLNHDNMLQIILHIVPIFGLRLEINHRPSRWSQRRVSQIGMSSGGNSFTEEGDCTTTFNAQVSCKEYLGQ